MVDRNVAGKVVKTNPSSLNLKPLRPDAVGRFLAAERTSDAAGAAASHFETRNVALELDVFAERFAGDVATDFARAEGAAEKDIGKPINAETRAAEVLGCQLETLVPGNNPAREIVPEAVRKMDVAVVPKCDVR